MRKGFLLFFLFVVVAWESYELFFLVFRVLTSLSRAHHVVGRMRMRFEEVGEKLWLKVMERIRAEVKEQEGKREDKEDRIWTSLSQGESTAEDFGKPWGALCRRQGSGPKSITKPEAGEMRDRRPDRGRGSARKQHEERARTGQVESQRPREGRKKP